MKKQVCAIPIVGDTIKFVHSPGDTPLMGEVRDLYDEETLLVVIDAETTERVMFSRILEINDNKVESFTNHALLLLEEEPQPSQDVVRDHNIGTSNYASHKIQPWDIWMEYHLNPWDADIVKRVLREKSTDPRRLDYEKIIHVCQERIRQIDSGYNF